MESLATIDYVVIAAYFLAMVGIGIYSVTKAKSREDYLVAGRRLGFPLFFGCMAAMAVGGAVTVGGTGKGYGDGIAGLWVGGSLGMGLILLGLLVSSKLSRLRALSINEVIERNYGPSARVFGSVLTIIYTVALTIVQVVAMGAIMEGIWPELGTKGAMTISGLVVVFYTFLGGMWSVTMTDIVQFVIKTVGLMILVPIFVLSDDRIGGIGGLMDKIPDSHWDFGAYGGWGSLYWVLLYVPGLVIGQDIWQRVFTARSDKIARTGTLGAGVYSIFYALAAVMLGMSVLAAGIQLDKPGLAFETGITEFLPPGIAGLLLAAALAASMSVASATILACSTVVYNDIYLRFVKGQKSSNMTAAVDNAAESDASRNVTNGELTTEGASAFQRHEEMKEHTSIGRDVWINRGIALTIGVVIIGLALWISSLEGDPIFKALDLAYGFLSGAVFIPVFATFVLKKVSPKAGLVALAASGLAIAATMIYGESTNKLDFAIGGNWPIMVGIAVGLISYAVMHVIDQHKITPNLEISEDDLALGESTH